MDFESMKFLKVMSLLLVAIFLASALFYEKIIASVLLPQYIDWARETDEKGFHFLVNAAYIRNACWQIKMNMCNLCDLQQIPHP